MNHLAGPVTPGQTLLGALVYKTAEAGCIDTKVLSIEYLVEEAVDVSTQNGAGPVPGTCYLCSGLTHFAGESLPRAGREGDPPAMRTHGNRGIASCPSVAGADQHLDAPVAREPRVTERAGLDLVGRHASLDERVANGRDPTVAQVLVARSVPRGSMEPSIATWMDGFWSRYARVSDTLGALFAVGWSSAHTGIAGRGGASPRISMHCWAVRPRLCRWL
jgi:hypothetical protein